MRERQHTQAMIQDPVATGSVTGRRIRVGTTAHAELRLPGATPLPAVEDVLCGFDFLFQASADFLGRYAGEVIGTPEVEIAYRAHALSDLARAGIASAISGGGGDYGTARVRLFDYDYQNVAYRVRLHSPALRFLEDVPRERARFTWRFDLSLHRVETEESFTRRRGMEPPRDVPGGPPGMSDMGGGVSTEGWGPMGLAEETVPLGSGHLEVLADPVVISDPETLSVRAKLDPASWVITAGSAETLVTELLDLDETEISTRITDQVYSSFIKTGAVCGRGIILTPVVSLRPREPLDDTAFGPVSGRRLEVRQKVVPGNLPFAQVFCICGSTGSESGDLDAVPPFTGSGNYALAAAEDLVAAIVQSRWESARRSMQTTIEDLDYTVTADGESYSGIGSADVQVSFATLDDVRLDPGPDEAMPNSLRLQGEYEIRLIRLILEDGTEVPPTSLDGDFTTPAIEPFVLHVLPFSAPADSDGGPVSSDFMNQLGAHLLGSVYLPFPNGGVRLARLAGGVHSPSGVVVMNGSAQVS